MFWKEAKGRRILFVLEVSFQHAGPRSTPPAKKVAPEQLSRPETAEIDPEVLAFRKQFDGISPLDGLVRQGARQMLQTAIEAEVDEFLLAHVDRVDEQGRRRVVRNGYLPPRDIQTGLVL